MDVETACRQAALSIVYPELKAEQLEAMKTFVSGRDVFCSVANRVWKEFDFCKFAISV